ncbi:cob(I)yrinic acid a,c-diamide adenosyltransferase [Cerasicoccus frondis]|uniref:cob(I)yrinic acid a,c-diamide adenosyltransferase n=1 Tax=Cerasicoccus frondis TaxID=490090 RepID=UPI00285262B0|nr:cob(I)yrinic acid a,c-diamide adenosyltransferase [Cerasicoccus frondis]
MSIATKRGDQGTTSLVFGRRVAKDHPRVVSYGTVDELNSALGLCRAHAAGSRAREFILATQHELISLMAELATDNADQQRYQEKSKHPITKENLARIDELITSLESEAGGFEGWILPGENAAQAFFDQARTTCRRAERMVVTLQSKGGVVRPLLLQYLNRLADALWLLGRDCLR